MLEPCKPYSGKPAFCGPTFQHCAGMRKKKKSRRIREDEKNRRERDEKEEEKEGEE